MEINHIALWVTDLEATKRFYIDILDLEKKWQLVDDEGVTNLYVSDPANFEIQFKYDTKKNKTIDTEAIDHLALTVRDIHRTFQMVKKQTNQNIFLEPAEVDSRRGYTAKIALIEGPNGYTIELVQKTE